MRNLNRLTFSWDRSTTAGAQGPFALTPIVDRVSLLERIMMFEQGRGFSPAGAYGGIVPSYFRFGDLRKYFVGQEDQQWPQADHLWVLGCDCGEVGCWPLTARVVVLNDTVTWMAFSQEYRPNWDYTDFGPFIFARHQYQRAVEWAAAQVESDSDHGR